MSANIYVNLRNLVSDTIVDSKVKTIGNVPMGHVSELNRVQILEISQRGLILSAPKYTCAAGHSLEIEINAAHLGRKPLIIQIFGRAKEVEQISDNQERIAIELKTASVVTWKEFCQIFSERQSAIHKFFQKVRGY
jgi:hypothetical protein